MCERCETVRNEVLNPILKRAEAAPTPEEKAKILEEGLFAVPVEYSEAFLEAVRKIVASAEKDATTAVLKLEVVAALMGSPLTVPSILAVALDQMTPRTKERFVKALLIVSGKVKALTPAEASAQAN